MLHLLAVFVLAAPVMPKIYRGAVPEAPFTDLGVVVLSDRQVKDQTALMSALEEAKTHLGADAFVYESQDVRHVYVCSDCPIAARAEGYYRAVRFATVRRLVQEQYRALTRAYFRGQVSRSDYDQARIALNPRH